ncbi:hypothetical protein OSB04_016857 [Centaurea solstitialis]|uniref:CCHC-type domain-containing protein n=1 Tax=Centaurea solstitialis TaxID=347529 RepID=A0AA38WA69_9ASTR|nr:hypothetical protein OSB04_016857 [Centaurea solstitialis]
MSWNDANKRATKLYHLPSDFLKSMLKQASTTRVGEFTVTTKPENTTCYAPVLPQRKSGVIRTNEDNNLLFLKSLGTEWLNVTMSMRTSLDLEFMSITELYGSLASLEPQVLQLKSSIGGPLALIAEDHKGKVEKKKIEDKRKKKKAFVTETEDDRSSSEEEMSMKEMMKTLVSFTRAVRKGVFGGSKNYEKKWDDERRGYGRGSFEKRDVERKNDSRGDEGKEESQRNTEGCFRCGKLEHYASECWATGPMTPQNPTLLKSSPKPKQDSAYFKRKADFYKRSELVTDESSEEDEPQKGLIAFEDSEEETEFCGMAKGESEGVNKDPEVSSELKELYSEIVENIDLHQEELNNLKEKLSVCKKEMNTLTEERTRFFTMYEQAEANRIELYKKKNDEIKNLRNERTNALSVKEFFQTERESLHRDLFDRELKIRKFQDAQNVFKKIRVNMGRRGLGFSECEHASSSNPRKSLQTIFRSAQNIRSHVPDSKSVFKRRKMLNKPESKTPLIFTNVAFEDYIDSFSPSEKSESVTKNLVSQSQLGIFEFGNSSTQEECDFQFSVQTFEKKLSPGASEFIPRHLTEESEKSVNSDIFCETNSSTDTALDFEMVTCPENTSPSDSNLLNVELTKPKFSRKEKEKWVDTNQSSISAHAGNSMRRESQKKKNFLKNKEPRLVRKSCTKMPKTMKGSTFLNSVPIFENFNEKFKSLSCQTKFCKCVDLMHDLSNHVHNSSCLVMNPRGLSSRDFKGHLGNSDSQKNKPKPRDAVAYLKHANLKGPNWKWVPKSLVVRLQKQSHVSTWYIDS